MSRLDPEDSDSIGRCFGIAKCMAAEIEYENDEAHWSYETAEARFTRMRTWVICNLNDETVPLVGR